MSDLVKLVLDAAAIRKEIPVEAKYVQMALYRIASNEEQVEMYTTGMPSLKAVYGVAARLQAEEAIKH